MAERTKGQKKHREQSCRVLPSQQSHSRDESAATVGVSSASVPAPSLSGISVPEDRTYFRTHTDTFPQLGEISHLKFQSQQDDHNSRGAIYPKETGVGYQK